MVYRIVKNDETVVSSKEFYRMITASQLFQNVRDVWIVKTLCLTKFVLLTVFDKVLQLTTHSRDSSFVNSNWIFLIYLEPNFGKIRCFLNSITTFYRRT